MGGLGVKGRDAMATGFVRGSIKQYAWNRDSESINKLRLLLNSSAVERWGL